MNTMTMRPFADGKSAERADRFIYNRDAASSHPAFVYNGPTSKPAFIYNRAVR